MMKKVFLLLTLFSSFYLMADVAGEYQQKCANCHGPKAKQPALGKSDSIAGRSINSLTKDLKGYKAGRVSKNGMGGLMKAQVKQLSSQQIKALAEYISGLPK